MDNIKKEIFNFIEKNKITNKYIEAISKIETLENLKEYNLKIKNKKLYNYIQKLLLDKENNNNNNNIHYLEYDNKIFLDLINSKKINEDNNELFNHINQLRETQKNKLNIQSYCIDGIKNIIYTVDNLLSLVNQTSSKKKEIVELADTFNILNILSKNSIFYFSISINEKILLKEEKEFLHNLCKKQNIKKNVFNPLLINTNKDILNKFAELIDNIKNEKDNTIIDVYSYRKTLSLINYFK